MYFINIETENLIQQFDRLRIDCKLSTGTNDHPLVTKVEIKPEASGSFIQVSDNSSPLDSDRWFLDWQYITIGSKAISIKFTFADLSTIVETKTINCITESADKLFSNDDDLKIHEDDIMRFLKPGKTSFKNFHRRAQKLILSEIDRKGVRTQDGSKITEVEILDNSEVKEWSTFMTLKLIFESISNADNDIFQIKSKKYKGCELIASSKTYLILDYNKDGVTTESDKVYIGSIEVFR